MCYKIAHIYSKEATEAGVPSGEVKATMIKVNMSKFNVVLKLNRKVK